MAGFATKTPAQRSWDDIVIFVTVGTTMPFDELLSEVDRLGEAGLLGEPVISQVGQSKYKMIHGEHFIGRPSIASLIAESSLVISHGGATVIQLLLAKKPFVAFPNPRGAGDHQTAFLRQVSQVADISWSSDVQDLFPLLQARRLAGPSVMSTNVPTAGSLIARLL